MNVREQHKPNRRAHDMRTTINIKAETPAELKSALRSLAAKLNAEDFQAGADIKVGGARVQVSTPEAADIRQWGRMLSASQAGAILREHSLEAEYEEEHGTLSADAQVDAADLLAWLGY